MNIPAAYTPLESLFLFQSLLAHGVDDEAFTRISELLTNNALIKSGGTYDPARLSPEALQDLFLLLLRDELKSEVERAAGGEAAAVAATAVGRDGCGSPATKKRKLGTLPLPTLKDVYENVEKVPVLVDRLYARYREFMVNSIREDERKFANVQKEIQLLERSEKERLAKVARQNGPPNLVSRDQKAVVAGPGGATPNGPNALPPGPGPGPVAPALAGRGVAPSTPAMPPKTSSPATIAAPKVAPPPHLTPGTQPQRAMGSPKPPHGVASVLQAPAGAPTQSGTRVLQPPAQSPKQVLPSRPESSASPPADAAAASQAPHLPAGALKWEKPYQPPPQIQPPQQAGQFTPVIPPNAPVHQKVQQQQSQWSQQQQQQQQQSAHPPSQTPPNQQQQPHYAPHQQGQVMHPQIQQPQARPTPAKPGLVSPQSAAQLVPPFQPGSRPVGSLQARPPPSAAQGRPIQPQQSFQPYQNQRPHPAQHGQQTSQGAHIQQPHVQQAQKPPLSQLAQKFQQQKSPAPRPLAVATPSKVVAAASQAVKGTPGSAPPQRWSQSQQSQHGSPSPSTPTAPKDKPSTTSYVGQQPRPAIPEHIIRQAATPGPARKVSPASPALRLPAPSSPVLPLKRGFGTKWASYSTPSTPDPTVSEPQSPAFEPVSPPQRPSVTKPSPVTRPVPASQLAKATSKGDVTPVSKARGRPPRAVQRGRGSSATPSASGTRRSQSAASQTDELSLDHSVPAPKVKKEAATPRLREETGDTTADESVYSRGVMVTPGSISRVSKRKRQDPVDLTGPQTHVLWTRGFTKVSSSALDQVSSHRDANMFATALRERDAPNYRQIVLQPQDITSIRSAIKQGNKAAQQAANNLPGGDPGTAVVWLPISDDLVPPRGIINSAHLERELVHMFCNAIMYNPDPDRGPGPGFLKRSRNDEEEVVGYRLDENGVVKNTQSMFVEVEKLMGDLRAAEKERGLPPISITRQGSVATPADDTAEEEDELAGDGDTVSVPGTVKRRRINTRS